MSSAYFIDSVYVINTTAMTHLTVKIQISVLLGCDVASLDDCSRRFETTWCSHLQGTWHFDVWRRDD